MPIDTSFVEPRTFILRATGHVSFAEVQRAFDEILAHSRLSKGVHVLTDARGVTGAPSGDELRDMAMALRPLLERGLGGYAIVTDSSFMYGVARMFAIFAEWMSANVGVFRDMAAAEMWLASQTPEDA
jgi:hypothetical protein